MYFDFHLVLTNECIPYLHSHTPSYGGWLDSLAARCCAIESFFVFASRVLLDTDEVDLVKFFGGFNI